MSPRFEGSAKQANMEMAWDMLEQAHNEQARKEHEKKVKIHGFFTDMVEGINQWMTGKFNEP